MSKKIFRITSLLFLCESILLLLGLHYGPLTYGPDLSTYFMVVLIVFNGFLVFILNMVFIEKEMSVLMTNILTLIILGFGLYYFLEGEVYTYI